MGDIPVAANDHLTAALAQRGHVRQEEIHEAELCCLALLGTGTGREVERYNRQRPEIELKITAFGVKLLISQAFDDAIGGATAVNSHPAVALLHRTMEVSGVYTGLTHLR